MTDNELYAPFSIVDTPLDHSKLPTVDQVRTAYRKQKLKPCFLFFTRGTEYACPLAAIAFARGITRGNDEDIAQYWRTQLGYWNAAWLFHAVDGGQNTDVLNDDQRACYNRGTQIRMALIT